MPQNILNALSSGPTNQLQPLKSDAIGALLVTSGGSNSSLNLSASTVIKTGPGRVATINVITPGAAGALYDSATIGGVGAANEIYIVPAAVGFSRLDWPFVNGLVYVPGAAQVSAVAYS